MWAHIALGVGLLCFAAACSSESASDGNSTKNANLPCNGSGEKWTLESGIRFCTDRGSRVHAIPRAMRTLCAERKRDGDTGTSEECDAKSWSAQTAAKFFGAKLCPIGTLPTAAGFCCTGSTNSTTDRFCYAHYREGARP